MTASSSYPDSTGTALASIQMLDVIGGLQARLDKYNLYINDPTTLSMEVAMGSAYIK